MKLSDFDYPLPDELIAQYPEPQRGQSRLLYLECPAQSLADHRFNALGELLNPGDLLVLNNTRVIPARVFAHKESGGQLELLLERVLSDSEFVAQIRASKSPKPGTKILLNKQPVLEVVKRVEDLFHLCLSGFDNVYSFLQAHGHVPLPPYIDREDESLDEDRYQTVYAREPGAVAAPTAGLHFTLEHLEKLAGQGIDHVQITLHVGAGTFQPVRVKDIEQHRMHHEYACIDEDTVGKINNRKKQGGRIIAVGTTSLRTLEAAAVGGKLQPMQGDTDLFIYPGFEFNVVDGLITNFHLPQSTLLMLVSAFAGQEFIRRAYVHAIQERYRFFSYGDAMFINR
ncbi:MAG: tRNA preQ1(34) S-adenosylmethionine ribosyltransferase-isomerase QueA [Thiotrichales bacterium]|nr:tRNA preQ1(34) S-adenosylmethionine ribosyltransferase-isomerase QueA [Thiotrichales bacterium]